MNANKTGAEIIAEERAAHFTREGYTAAHDAAHDRGQLLAAAICYAEVPLMRLSYLPEAAEPMVIEMMATRWPWEEEWWKPSDSAVRNLAKAGALIAAEIDRLNALAGKG